MSPFYINKCSLSINIKQFFKTKIDFNITGISESRINKYKCPIDSIDLKNSSYEFCPSESPAVGTLLFFSNYFSNKPRSNLCIYKSNEFVPTFIEILNWKKKYHYVESFYFLTNLLYFFDCATFQAKKFRPSSGSSLI